MAENSKIEWTKHTFNPWIGCQKVGPGCEHCYAEAMMDRRLGRVEWGPYAARARTSASYWQKPLAWDKAAKAAGERHRVFCASLADVFDNHESIVDEWRQDLWRLIHATPHLDWMLLTKRPGNIRRYLPDYGDVQPNVWLGCTVVNQEEADRDIPKLLATPAAVRFLSMEPLLGPVDLTRWSGIEGDGGTMGFGLDLVIVGGESGPGARPMHPDWARSLRDQCQAAGVAHFFKQWGEWGPDVGIPPGRDPAIPGGDPIMEGKGPCAFLKQDTWQFAANGYAVDLSDSSGCGEWVFRLGKKLNGRLLDGREWNEMPTQKGGA